MYVFTLCRCALKVPSRAERLTQPSQQCKSTSSPMLTHHHTYTSQRTQHTLSYIVSKKHSGEVHGPGLDGLPAGCRFRASEICPYLAHIRCSKVRCVHLSKWPFWLRASVPQKTFACIRFRNTPCVHPFSESLKTNISIRTSETLVLCAASYHIL